MFFNQWKCENILLLFSTNMCKSLWGTVLQYSSLLKLTYFDSTWDVNGFVAARHDS